MELHKKVFLIRNGFLFELKEVFYFEVYEQLFGFGNCENSLLLHLIMLIKDWRGFWLNVNSVRYPKISESCLPSTKFLLSARIVAVSITCNE